MLWKKRKPKTKVKDRILPEDYYTIVRTDPDNGYDVLINQGPYSGFVILLKNRIKIRVDALTSVPNLMYNWSIADHGQFDDLAALESSEKLSRIVAAIAVEILSKEIEQNGSFDTIENPLNVR